MKLRRHQNREFVRRSQRWVVLPAIGLLFGCMSAEEHDDAGRRAGDQAIDFYQDHVGHQWGFHCDFEPSCSQFGRDAVQEYGLLRGSMMTADRLMRDHDLAPNQYAVTADSRPFDPAQSNAVFVHPASLKQQELDPLEEQLVETSPRTSAEEVFAFAQQLFSEREWSWAALEFRHYLFHFPDGADRLRAKRNLVSSYSYLRRYAEALHLVEQLPASEQPLWRAVLLRQSGRPKSAYQAVDGPGRESQFLRGLLAVEQGNREAAREHFQQLPDPDRSTLLTRLEDLDAAPSRSATWCGIASAVLPGSGQAIAGRTADGAVAFFANGVLLGGSAVALHNDENVTAAALGLLGLGFYAGNIYGGVNAAKQFNRRHEQSWRQKIGGLIRDQKLNIGVTPTQDGGALSLYFRF